MSKAYVLAGYFLLGVSLVGFFSYTALAFPKFQYYGFWISIVVSIMFVIAGVADDFFSQVLQVTYQQYIGGLITAIALIIVGGLIQWVK
jgi:hypothetical protein